MQQERWKQYYWKLFNKAFKSTGWPNMFHDIECRIFTQKRWRHDNFERRNRVWTRNKEGLSLEDLATQFDDFLDEAHRLKKLYAQQIAVIIGAETEYITTVDLDSLEASLKRCDGRIEYLVGSVHHVNGIPIDFDLPTFQKALNPRALEPEAQTLERFLCEYFESQFEMLQRFQPEIVGHFDLCRLYNSSLRFSDYPMVWNLIKRNIAYVVEYGGLFEINAAAFRKQWSTAYPAEDVVEVGVKFWASYLLAFTIRPVDFTTGRTLCTLGRQPWSPCGGAQLFASRRISPTS